MKTEKFIDAILTQARRTPFVDPNLCLADSDLNLVGAFIDDDTFADPMVVQRHGRIPRTHSMKAHRVEKIISLGSLEVSRGDSPKLNGLFLPWHAR